MLFAELDAAGWAVITTAAIAAVGNVVLQGLQMYLSYRRDTAIKADVNQVVQATNGAADRVIAAEVTAEKVVAKAEVAANKLLITAAAAAAAAPKEKN